MGQRTGKDGDILKTVNCPDWHKIGIGEALYRDKQTEPRTSRVTPDRYPARYNDDHGDPSTADRKRSK